MGKKSTRSQAYVNRIQTTDIWGKDGTSSSSLAAYEEKCASLPQVISEKDKNFDEMQGKLASAQLELTEQAMVVKQANRDLISAQKQLQTQVEMQRGLERSLGATEA
ncbi:unnamed protein product [Sphagnum jensenii]|uniref:Uncharacterized protein n=1 Tax=Sphagnum jensenii TaxID=128206 RepID=A0ABP1B9H9_9BRYO